MPLLVVHLARSDVMLLGAKAVHSHTELKSCNESSLLGHDKLNEVIYVCAKYMQNPNCPQCEHKNTYGLSK